MDDKDEIQPRKRGRPRKNQLIDKPTKKEYKNNFSEKIEEEIIIRLPILLKDIEEYDSKKDESFIIETEDEDTVLTLSDEDNESVSENKNYYDLMREISEKDKLIRKLKDDILEYNTTLSEYNNTLGEKENNIVPLKVPMIHYKDGHAIVPEKTVISCWWCTMTFDSIPVYIPESYFNDTFSVFGCFCSFNCAAAYNLDMNDYKVKERNSLLMMLATIYYKKSVKEFTIAPRREILEKFGGILTINEYRKNFYICSKEYRLIMPPMSSVIPLIEIITKDKPTIKENKFTSDAIKKTNILNAMGLEIKKMNKN